VIFHFQVTKNGDYSERQAFYLYGIKSAANVI